MERLKIAINVVIALLLVVIAVTIITMAIESTTKKSWSYDYYGGGNYPTLEICIEEEMLVRNIREDEDAKPHSTTCRNDLSSKRLLFGSDHTLSQKATDL